MVCGTAGSTFPRACEECQILYGLFGLAAVGAKQPMKGKKNCGLENIRRRCARPGCCSLKREGPQKGPLIPI